MSHSMTPPDWCQDVLTLMCPSPCTHIDALRPSWARTERCAFPKRGRLLLIRVSVSGPPASHLHLPQSPLASQDQSETFRSQWQVCRLLSFAPSASVLKLIYSFNHEPGHITGIKCKYLNANYCKTNRPLCPKQTGAVSGSQQTLTRRQPYCLSTPNARRLESVPPPPAPAAPATSLQKVLRAKSYPEWLTYVSAF